MKRIAFVDPDWDKLPEFLRPKKRIIKKATKPRYRMLTMPNGTRQWFMVFQNVLTS